MKRFPKRLPPDKSNNAVFAIISFLGAGAIIGGIVAAWDAGRSYEAIKAKEAEKGR